MSKYTQLPVQIYEEINCQLTSINNGPNLCNKNGEATQRYQLHYNSTPLRLGSFILIVFDYSQTAQLHHGTVLHPQGPT